MKITFTLRILLILTSSVRISISEGQTLFDIIPDLQSVEMQGGCRKVYVQDTDFLVSGHRYDTSYGGSDAKPWVGVFNYDGDMKSLFSLRDTAYDEPFIFSTLQLVPKYGTRWLGYAGRFINSEATPYLFEFDIVTGDIISALLLPNELFPDERVSASSIYYAGNRISLLSRHQDQDSVQLFITELDSNFSILKEFRLQRETINQAPRYFERKKDGTYIIISDSKRPGQHDDNSYDVTYMHVDSTGDVVRFKWSPADVPVSNLLGAAKRVIRASNGDWIILGAHNVQPDSCLNCSIDYPYLLSVSTYFDTLKSQISLRDLPPGADVLYHEYGLTEVPDGYIACGEFFKGNTELRPSSGWLFKTSFDGDSLWMRHIIPVGWEDERVVFANFYDVKATEFGTMVIAGQVTDRELEIIRPWILHLDQHGCLVPGCHIVGTADPTPSESKANQFTIYPNPVGDELFILSHIDSREDYMIRLFSESGIELRHAVIQPMDGAQFVLTTENLMPGVYFLTITNEVTGAIEQYSCVKQ